MYKNPPGITGESDIINYIDGYDIFNSRYLYLIAHKVKNKQYEVTRYPHRLDLICRDLSTNLPNSMNTFGFLLFSMNILHPLKLGDIIEYHEDLNVK